MQEGRPMEEAEDPYAQWQKEIEIEQLADIVGTQSPSPSPTPPGTPKHSPQPRSEAECGMHRYAPLHHGSVLHGSVRSPSTLVYSKNGAEEEGLGGETPFAGATRRGCIQDARRTRYPRGGVTYLLVLFVLIVHFFLFAPFFSRTLYICWLVCLGRKGGEELIRKTKERRCIQDHL